MSQNEAPRGQILTEAHEATMKVRHETYGDPFTGMNCAAEFMELYRKHAGSKYHKAHDEAVARVMIKLSRIACGAPGHRDSYVDLAAYIAIAFECQEISKLCTAPIALNDGSYPDVDLKPGGVTYFHDIPGFTSNVLAKTVNHKYNEARNTFKDLKEVIHKAKAARWVPVSKTNVEIQGIVKLKDGELYTVEDIKYENCFGEKIELKDIRCVKQWVNRQAIESVFVPVEA